MTEPLPELLDAKRLKAELGVTRAAAEAIMRRLPTVNRRTPQGLRAALRRRRLHRGEDVLEDGSTIVTSGRARWNP